MNRWSEAIEAEAARLRAMEARLLVALADALVRAVTLGIHSRHDAELVLAGAGYGEEEVERVLPGVEGAPPTLSLDALEKEQLRAAKDALGDGSVDGATAMYARKALGLTRGEIASALGYTDEAVERWENGAEPVPKRIVRGLVGMLGRAIEQTTWSVHDGGIQYVGVDWGSRPSETVYCRQEPDPATGAPPWPQSIRFVRSEDPVTGELLYRRLSSAPRYVGEFGDIDEPSVGDVGGSGRRG